MKKTASIYYFPNRPIQVCLPDNVLSRSSPYDGQTLIATNRTGISLSGHPDYYGLMVEKCDLMIDAMVAITSHAAQCTTKSEDKMRSTLMLSVEIMQRHFELLKQYSAAANDSADQMRTIVTMDIAIDCSRSTISRLLDMTSPVDGFMTKIAVCNLTVLKALKSCFQEPASSEIRSERVLQRAIEVKDNMESIYHHALKELTLHDGAPNTKKDRKKNEKGLLDALIMLERSDAYHHLFKITTRLVWVAKSIRQAALRNRHPF